MWSGDRAISSVGVHAAGRVDAINRLHRDEWVGFQTVETGAWPADDVC